MILPATFCDRYEIWAPTVHINPCWPLLTWRTTLDLPCALGMDTPWWASRGALDCTIQSTSFSRNANFWRDSRVQRCGFIGTNWEVQCMTFKNCHLIMWVYFAERGDFSYFFACWKIGWLIQLVPNMSTISDKHLGLQIRRQFPCPWPSQKIIMYQWCDVSFSNLQVLLLVYTWCTPFKTNISLKNGTILVPIIHFFEQKCSNFSAKKIVKISAGGFSEGSQLCRIPFVFTSRRSFDNHDLYLHLLSLASCLPKLIDLSKRRKKQSSH